MGKHITEYFLFPLAREVAGEGEHGGGGGVRSPAWGSVGGVEDTTRATGRGGGGEVRGRWGGRG